MKYIFLLLCVIGYFFYSAIFHPNPESVYSMYFEPDISKIKNPEIASPRNMNSSIGVIETAEISIDCLKSKHIPNAANTQAPAMGKMYANLFAFLGHTKGVIEPAMKRVSPK